MLAETQQEFCRRTGHAILERYGMTETLMNTSNPYDGLRGAGSVGPPLQGVAVRVIKRESGRCNRARCRSARSRSQAPTSLPAIGRMPRKRAANSHADGWFKTGDLGRIDGNGYVHIVGRAKDLVISGGYNVYPKEVESELERVPGVAESAVFGVPHPDFGEAVTAAVVLKPVRRSPRRRSSMPSVRAWRATRCRSAYCWSRSCRAIRWARCARRPCVRPMRGFFARPDTPQRSVAAALVSAPRTFS